MAEPAIYDRDSLLPWVDDYSHSHPSHFAFRAAMRCAPIAICLFVDSEPAGTTMGALRLFRALLGASLFDTVEPEQLRSALSFVDGPSSNDFGAPEFFGRGPQFAAAASAHFAVAAAASNHSGHHAIEAAAHFAEAFGESSVVGWRIVTDEAKAFRDLTSGLTGGLPKLKIPAEFADDFDRIVSRRFEQPRPDLEFWFDWYEASFRGAPQNGDVLRDVALIAEDVWEKGSEAVAAAIKKIEERHTQTTHAGQLVDHTSRDLLTIANSSGELVPIAEVKASIERFRMELPPTLVAVKGYIILEIERQQGRNYESELDAEESRRQISVLKVLYEAVSSLEEVVPTSGELDDSQAAKAQSLASTYVEAFMDWPRENSKDIADGVYRLALVGATAVLLPMIGVTASFALGAGLVLFGGKKVGDAMKVVKDLYPRN